MQPVAEAAEDASASAAPRPIPATLTNIGSDWNDISATVAFISKLRHVQKINLIAWSQGGPRAGGWTAQHPDQVARLVRAGAGL